MKRIEPESIGDVLRLTIQESGMAGRLDEVKAIEMWPVLVGERLARLTSRPRVSCGIMVVDVWSAPLRQELNMNRSTLISLINSRLGKEVIKGIRFR
ncbi:MAG: DUF721 domain-containing protein [Muribaculaceae bacterium]|nr:DUF721 domain-containing protein [Muribaculaceae bacterium]